MGFSCSLAVSLLWLVCLVGGCYGHDKIHYATKTAYRNRLAVADAGLEDEQFLRDQCTPVHVSHIYRHGTRYPATKKVRALERLHSRLTSSFTGRKHLPSLLHGWKSAFSRESDKLLSKVGKEEMEELGRRFRERYGSRVQVVEDNIYLITSTLSRAADSANAFVKGLGMDMSKIDKRTDDNLIRFFANCPRYRTGVRKNKTAMHEYHRFKAGPEVTKLVEDVKSRFHLKDIDFGADDIQLIYAMCGIEIANNVSTADESPWCQFFHPSEAKILEYMQDIRQYWKLSYPYRINAYMSCPLIADVIHHLHEAQRFWDRPSNFVLYFGHAETIIPVLTLLGLFKPSDHLRSDNFADIHANRTFRTSAISPLGGNLALELYRCSGKDHWDYFVRPLVNEAPVVWSLCERSFCPYKKVVKLFEKCAPGRYDHQDACALPEEPKKKDRRSHSPVRDEL